MSQTLNIWQNVATFATIVATLFGQRYIKWFRSFQFDLPQFVDGQRDHERDVPAVVRLPAVDRSIQSSKDRSTWRRRKRNRRRGSGGWSGNIRTRSCLALLYTTPGLPYMTDYTKNEEFYALKCKINLKGNVFWSQPFSLKRDFFFLKI